MFRTCALRDNLPFIVLTHIDCYSSRSRRRTTDTGKTKSAHSKIQLRFKHRTLLIFKRPCGVFFKHAYHIRIPPITLNRQVSTSLCIRQKHQSLYRYY